MTWIHQGLGNWDAGCVTIDSQRLKRDGPHSPTAAHRNAPPTGGDLATNTGFQVNGD